MQINNLGIFVQVRLMQYIWSCNGTRLELLVMSVFLILKLQIKHLEAPGIVILSHDFTFGSAGELKNNWCLNVIPG